jgi:hypothetical protein
MKRWVRPGRLARSAGTVDEEDPVQVIGFVLNHAGAHALPHEIQRLALAVQRLDPDAARSGYLTAHARHRQAALEHRNRVFGRQRVERAFDRSGHAGVDQHGQRNFQRVRVTRIHADLDHAQLYRFVDLGRG